MDITGCRMKPLHARTRAKLLCQFCAISLQKQAIFWENVQSLVAHILLILLSFFVAAYPHLPSTSVF